MWSDSTSINQPQCMRAAYKCNRLKRPPLECFDRFETAFEIIVEISMSEDLSIRSIRLCHCIFLDRVIKGMRIVKNNASSRLSGRKKIIHNI